MTLILFGVSPPFFYLRLPIVLQPPGWPIIVEALRLFNIFNE